MKQSQIFNNVSKIFTKYQHEPKTSKTTNKIQKELEQFLKDTKLDETGARLNFALYVVDNYALCAFLFIKGSDEKRFSRPKILWCEDIGYDKDSAYRDAMSIIE